MNSNEITINGKVYVPKTEQAQPEGARPEGNLILCIEARDLGDEVEVTAATNGRSRDILHAWAEASAKLLDDIGVPTSLALVLMEATKKMGKGGEDSND